MCRTPLLAATILALSLSIAQAQETPEPKKAGPQERAAAARLDPLARAAFWARQVELDGQDAAALTALSQALRTLGRVEEAANAATRALTLAPDDQTVLMEAARAHVARGQGFYAIEPARKAMAQAPKDWRPVSLLAVALEQAERDEEALAAHEQALKLAPGEPAVLTNAALYHAGHADLPQAERLLRQAGMSPAATTQMRLNLAMVVGLQGRLDEAEKLLRQEAPPEQVRANLEWLRARIAKPSEPSRSWNAMRAGAL